MEGFVTRVRLCKSNKVQVHFSLQSWGGGRHVPFILNKINAAQTRMNNVVTLCHRLAGAVK